MPEPLKNLYNPAFVAALSDALKREYPAFDSPHFQATVFDADWEGRELKARMRHITRILRASLPDDYRHALNILRAASAHMGAYGFELMFFPDFVEVYGLSDWEASLPALEHFTQQSSAEFAVRPFIIQDQARMMSHMLAWSQHENHHVRRLASEGCRPRLPWAMALPALKADPAPILPILENLRHDPSEYVRRSVANNLNDITKDHPQTVIAVLTRWQAEQASPEIGWIIRHALRTQIKSGNPAALALIGYAAGGAFAVKNLTVQPEQIALGEDITFSFEVESQADAPQNLLIDYAVHLVRANGKRSPKVFKLTQITLPAGESVTVRKKHSFRPITTRRYYPGVHGLDIQINGVVAAHIAFVLTE